MKLTDAITANPDIVLREEFDDWAILFHPLTAEAIGTGPVGVAIWKAIDGKRSVADIARGILSQFEDVPDSVEEDTLSFVSELHRRLFVSVID